MAWKAEGRAELKQASKTITATFGIQGWKRGPLALDEVRGRETAEPMASAWRVEVEQARSARTTRDIDRDSVTVGRGAESDLQLSDLRVSRLHCRLAVRGAELWIEDLGSRRGTRVNGTLLEAPRRLADRESLSRYA